MNLLKNTHHWTIGLLDGNIKIFFQFLKVLFFDKNRGFGGKMKKKSELTICKLFNPDLCKIACFTIKMVNLRHFHRFVLPLWLLPAPHYFAEALVSCLRKCQMLASVRL